MIELNEIYAMKTKPRKCPNCGSRKVNSVQGGFFHDRDKQQIGEGVLLRSHRFGGPLPSWECHYCGMEIHKETDIEVMSLF